MEEELYKKLNEALKDKFPGQDLRDEVIATMGEIVTNESLIEVIESIKDQTARARFIEATNADDMELAESIAKSCGIDTSLIINRIASEILSQ